MSSDWKQLHADLEKQGFAVEKRKGGHYKVSKDGKVYFLGGTPGRGRAWQNCLSGLRKIGFQA